MKGSIQAKDLIKGKISTTDLKQRFIIINGTEKDARDLGEAINIMAEDGWEVREIWGGFGHQCLMEKK
jgi:hypothetical protein